MVIGDVFMKDRKLKKTLLKTLVKMTDTIEGCENLEELKVVSEHLDVLATNIERRKKRLLKGANKRFNKARRRRILEAARNIPIHTNPIFKLKDRV
jgi:hypothetical protein